jgi:hypothetical protein
VQNRVAPEHDPQHHTEHEASASVLLRCEIVPLLEGTVIGLVFRYESNECFEMLQFRNVGSNDVTWRHVRFAQKTWEALSEWRKIATPPVNNAANHGAMFEIRIAPSPDGQMFFFLYNNNTITAMPYHDNDGNNASVALPLGLAVQSGVAQFRVETQ